MKKTYDFSKGTRGRFYKPNLKLNVPIYLDSKSFSFVESIAQKKHSDVSAVVNDLIKSDMQLAKAIS
ncbi:MAG: hypothetical protein ACD_79C01288G0003 [uncultured bacterium]|nr:MAG: hypothetical protein ACD_79C01288G0003 [uncultured bacterium]